MASVPIIVIHIGHASQIVPALYQARLWNPESPIFYISDRDYCGIDYVEYVPLLEHAGSASRLAGIYRHKHELSGREDVELICLERWLILLDFLNARKIKSCFCMDSDVMLYCDISLESGRFSPFDATLSRLFAGGELFINNIDILEGFQEFLFQMYSDPASRAFQWWQGEPTITDMHCLNYFFLRHEPGRWKIADSTDCSLGGVFGHNIWSEPDYEKDRETSAMRIWWKDGQPYGYHLKRKELIRFCSLHFQGVSKDLLVEYFGRFTLGSPVGEQVS